MFNYLKLKDLRAKKFTQEQLAEKINVSLRTYQSYEKTGEKIKVSDLLKIAKILKVSPCEFFENIKDYTLKKLDNQLNEDSAEYEKTKVHSDEVVKELRSTITELKKDKEYLKNLLTDYVDDLKKKTKAS